MNARKGIVRSIRWLSVSTVQWNLQKFTAPENIRQIWSLMYQIAYANVTRPKLLNDCPELMRVRKNIVSIVSPLTQQVSVAVSEKQRSLELRHWFFVDHLDDLSLPPISQLVPSREDYRRLYQAAQREAGEVEQEDLVRALSRSIRSSRALRVNPTDMKSPIDQRCSAVAELLLEVTMKSHIITIIFI